MERSVLVMLSDRSSAPTLLGCRPSARNSLGRSQKRFQLLTKRMFCSVHHENNHSFKANSLLNRSCPRRYVGRGPDTMIVVAGDVLRTVSIRLLKSLFSVSHYTTHYTHYTHTHTHRNTRAHAHTETHTHRERDTHTHTLLCVAWMLLM